MREKVEGLGVEMVTEESEKRRDMDVDAIVVVVGMVVKRE